MPEEKLTRFPQTARVVLFILFLIIVLARFCHLDILWAEEGYPSAAANQLLAGKMLYRDVWFDKPPLYALVYLLWGAQPGLALRCFGALYIILACCMIYKFAFEYWGWREAVWAAVLLGVFLTFGIPSAVIALAPDLLMVLPHIAAVYFAWRGRGFWSGFCAGVALLTNTKAAFVLAVCLLWQWKNVFPLAAGFAIPSLLFAMALWANHAWNDYVAQVWTWGLVYSRDTFVTHPVAEGVRRTLNWAGFQSAAVAGTFCFLWHERDSPDRLRFAGWVLISLLALAAGWRFFPRYYFQLLPVVCLLGARALATAKPAMRWFFVALLLIPVLRFGPRYISLGLDSLQGKPHTWTDLAMNNDSKQAGELVRAAAKPGDTLLVWGYRADVFVYSGLHAGTRFLDSQPLTGVMADRHLVSAKPSAPEWAMANRQELIHTKPTFLVDGLGPFNPSLGLEHYPDLRQWLAQYQVIGRTPTSIVYRLVQSQ